MSQLPVRIGIRELRDRLSSVLAQVRAGKTVVITDRNRPIAQLAALACADETLIVQRLAIEGRLGWGGLQLGPPARRPRGRGEPVSQAVVEDRR